MKTEMEPGVEEIKLLRECINNLVSVLALPAISTGFEAPRIVGTLLDILVGMLDLDFAYARVADPIGGTLEMVRPSQVQNRAIDPQDIGQALKSQSGEDPQSFPLLTRNPIGDGDASIWSVRLGLQDSFGVIVAGSCRTNFPTSIEKLLLTVAANQLVIGMQEARLLSEQKRLAEELNQRVALRTSELVAANYELEKQIAERKRIEEALRQSEDRLRLAIDTIPGLVWSSLPDGHIDFLNQRWREYTGLTLEQACGWGWQQAIHPEDVAGLVDYWKSVLKSGKPGETEARLRRFDGVYRWFLFRGVPLFDETGKLVSWYGQTTDIDDRRRAEEKLRQDERELRRITDAIPQAISVLAPDGSALYANEFVLGYTGLSLEDVKADDFHSRMFHPDDVERIRDERRKALSRGEPFEAELRARRKDGRYRWFLVRYNPFRDENGTIIRWYATGTDIEDRKQAEERVHKENLALREEIDRTSMFEEIVGSSRILQKVLRQVAKVAPTDSTVLILGETGTGKELIARAIHKQSKRSARAFIRVNCAAVPSSLIASELFGHEKGAFTGALQRRLGRFESAQGGTIFLDEIGELPAETQIALLRVLQEREIERVGSSQPVSVDVRVLAATNRSLKAAVAAGAFREDLFYRLNVFPIEVPSLRERADDIPLLLEYFVERYAKKAGKNIRNIEKKTLELFRVYKWPGNIRELQNVIERAVILCEDETFSVDETWLLPESPRAPRPLTAASNRILRLNENQEREIIEAALSESKGRVAGPSGAAIKLGIPRQTLESKIASLKINKYQFKSA